MRPHVQIEDESFERLRAYFIEWATKWPEGKLAMELRSAPYEPYWAVKQQLLLILGEVNRMRKSQGLSELPYKVVLGQKRVQIQPFADVEEVEGDSLIVAA